MPFSSNPYYSVITIDHTKVSSAESDYIFWINDLPSDAFAEIHSTGKDIRFSDSSGVTELAFDIIDIDTTGGTCDIRVLVPSISVSVDTSIRIWYGDHTLSLYAATDTYGRNAVYTPKYEAYYAMHEEVSGTGTTDVYVDRTGNSNDGDDSISATGQTGKVGAGQEFDSVDDSIILPSTNFQSLTEGTIIAWIYLRTANKGAIFNHGSATTGANVGIMEIGDFTLGGIKPRWVLRTGNVARITANTPAISLNEWHLLTVSTDSSGVRMSTDGVDQTITVYQGSTSNTQWLGDQGTSGNHTRIGVHRYGSDYRWFDGFIDEVGVSHTALSNGYITTTYNNQNSPSTFFSVGSKQTVSSPHSFSTRYILVY